MGGGELGPSSPVPIFSTEAITLSSIFTCSQCTSPFPSSPPPSPPPSLPSAERRHEVLHRKFCFEELFEMYVNPTKGGKEGERKGGRNNEEKGMTDNLLCGRKEIRAYIRLLAFCVFINKGFPSLPPSLPSSLPCSFFFFLPHTHRDADSDGTVDKHEFTLFLLKVSFRPSPSLFCSSSPSLPLPRPPSWTLLTHHPARSPSLPPSLPPFLPPCNRCGASWMRSSSTRSTFASRSWTKTAAAP